METPTIKSSFIPKRGKEELSHNRKNTENLFMIISVIILFAAVGGWGGYFVYKVMLIDDKEIMEEELSRLTESGAEIEFIKEIEGLERKLKIADSLLSSHTDISQFFEFLSLNVLTDSIRFRNMSFANDRGDLIKVQLSGIAKDLSSLWLQRDVLRKTEFITNDTLGSIAIDKESGEVSFTMDFDLDRRTVSYESSLGISESEKVKKVKEE